ncbi:MAG: S8 family serine peptidase, partial [Methylococcales bacterium]|nr:S8 family serine peptidase [Methylococcales bacterium]
MDEDQLNDWERGHTSEQVAYFVSQQPILITADSDPRVTEGLAALYTFSTESSDTIYDVSGVNQPLDLTISAPNEVLWQPDGVKLTGNGEVISAETATDLKNTCVQAQGLTIEAWIQSDTSNTGETTILALGESTSQRNFMLGQRGNDWVARIRTTPSDADGGAEIVAEQSVYTQDLQHVVFTWGNQSGIQRITVDGVQIASAPLAGNLNLWDTHYHLSLGNEGDGTQNWAGALQLVAVYCRELNSAEISTNYTAGIETIVDAIAPNEAPAHIQVIKADALHANNITGAGVTIAILDSGIDLSALCKQPLAVFDATLDQLDDNDGDADDRNGHGSFMAGIALGSAANNNGLSVGVAP